MELQRRYQRFGPEGIVWSKWFTVKKFDNIDDAEQALLTAKKTKEVSRKLKGEYRLI